MMRKFIRSLVFLFSIATLNFILVPGNYSSAAEAEYNLTKTNQTTYKGESILVFTEDITLQDLNSYGIASYPEVKEIIVAEGVTRFDWNLILRNFFPNLESISISSTVSEIYFYTKLYESIELKYDKLKIIQVAEDNAYYTAKDNCLYNKEMSHLIQYPMGSSNTTYIIPDTVKTIERNAFANVKMIQSVTIGASLESDQYGPIKYRLSNIMEYKVDSKNPYYSVIDGVLFNKEGDTLLIYPGKKGTSYQVPEGTVTIESYAFYENELKYIKLPSTLKIANDSAFSACSELISITIPKSVSSIDIRDFVYLDSLEEIHVESGNKLYASYNGILYNAAKTEMLLVPEAYKETVLKLPSTLVDLYVNRFNFEKIIEVVIPKGVKNIYSISGNSKFFEKITLDSGNKNFVMYKGSVYNKEKTKLVLFKKQQKAEFPSTLKKIDVHYLNKSGITEMVISAKAKITPAGENVYDIPTLKKITVDKNNPYYTVQNNMLLNKKKTELYDAPRNLTTLRIPATVKEVLFPIFYDDDTNKLKKIVIPKSVTRISELTLANIKSLENIEVEKGNSKYTTINGVLYTKDLSTLLCYPLNKPDKSFIMPDNVKSIEFATFQPLSYKLESITLSKMLGEVYYGGLREIKTLKEIKAHKDNANYKSLNGVLYNKDMTELLLYPLQKRDTSFTIPDTVMTVSGFNIQKSKYVNRDGYYTINIVSNPYLETLHIGKNVKDLFVTFLNYQIWGFENLQNISVSKDNPYFSAKDGVLYNKNYTIMYIYPTNSKNTTFTVSKDVKDISEKVSESIAINKFLKTIVVETGNQYFSTDGLCLRNFNGDYKYAKLGEELPKKVYNY